MVSSAVVIFSLGFRISSGGGVAVTCLNIKLVGVAPSNGTLPVSISYKMQPSAYWSARASMSAADACSGDIYSGVPKTDPTSVSRPL